MEKAFKTILISLLMLAALASCGPKPVDLLSAMQEQISGANSLETLFKHHNAIKTTFQYYGSFGYDGDIIEEISPETLYAKLPDGTWALFSNDGQGTSYAVYQDAYYMLRQDDKDKMGMGVFIDDGFFEGELLKQLSEGSTYGWAPGDKLESVVTIGDNIELVSSILPRPALESMFGITDGKLRAEGVVEAKSYELLSNKEYYTDADGNERLISELVTEYDQSCDVPEYINVIREKLKNPAETCALSLVFDFGAPNERQYDYLVPKDIAFVLMTYEQYDAYEDEACTKGFSFPSGELPAELTLYMKKVK